MGYPGSHFNFEIGFDKASLLSYSLDTKKKLHISKQTRALVFKETVVLHRWGRETQNFGFELIK